MLADYRVRRRERLTRHFYFMKNLKELLFDFKYFENDAFIPSEEDKKWMEQNEVEYMIFEHTNKQKELLFADSLIQYDSDGDEYSHSTWPYKIIFTSTREAEIYLEDDGVLIEYNGFYLKFPDIKTLTMANFILGLDLAGIKYELLNP